MGGRLIYKEYKTMKAAERYLNTLYSKYNYVRLVDFPKHLESALIKFCKT